MATAKAYRENLPLRKLTFESSPSSSPTFATLQSGALQLAFLFVLCRMSTTFILLLIVLLLISPTIALIVLLLRLLGVV
jgi:hypothetical protein